MNNATKEISNTIAGGSLIPHTFVDDVVMLDRVTKIKRAWHTRESDVSVATNSKGMSVAQHQRDEEYDHDMSHLKTLIILITKHLMGSSSAKINFVGSQGKPPKYDADESNFINNQVGVGIMPKGLTKTLSAQVKETKVKTITRRITFSALSIEIKATRTTKMGVKMIMVASTSFNRVGSKVRQVFIYWRI